MMALVPNFSIDMAKSGFINAKAVTDRFDSWTLKGFRNFGQAVRRKVRRSMKKARRMKLAQLNKDDRQTLHIINEYRRRKGIAEAKPPFIPSNPGEPPRVRQGLLRKLVLFFVDPDRRSVVIGPASFRPGKGGVVPRLLEEGGTTTNVIGERVRLASRPYMAPPFKELHPKIPRFLAGNNF